MRANVGITSGSLYVSAATGGYAPAGNSTVQTDALAVNTTYLLAMKRTGSDISAALIEANGDLSTLNAEPTWSVVHAGLTGVQFDKIVFVLNGTNGSWMADEFRVASTWAGAVDGLQVIPEPGTYALILSALCLAFVIQRRRVSAR